MAVKISRLEIENVKRVRAVTLEPDANGLTVIGGRNGQGKTSVLDAIAWALGGNRFRPTDAQFDGSVLPPEIKIRLSNGLIAPDPRGIGGIFAAQALDFAREDAFAQERVGRVLRAEGLGQSVVHCYHLLKLS